MASTDTLMWTSQDPRQSTMFTTQGIVYRFIVSQFLYILLPFV